MLINFSVYSGSRTWIRYLQLGSSSNPVIFLAIRAIHSPSGLSRTPKILIWRVQYWIKTNTWLCLTLHNFDCLILKNVAFYPRDLRIIVYNFKIIMPSKIWFKMNCQNIQQTIFLVIINLFVCVIYSQDSTEIPTEVAPTHGALTIVGFSNKQ